MALQDATVEVFCDAKDCEHRETITLTAIAPAGMWTESASLDRLRRRGWKIITPDGDAYCPEHRQLKAFPKGWIYTRRAYVS